MSTSQRIAGAILSAIALSALITACSTPRADAPAAPPAPRLGDVHPAPPSGEVVVEGLVMDKEGRDVQLCYGVMALSYPPQCGGLPLDGWDWGSVDGSETAGDSTFGSYAVTGRYDGERLTVTAPPIPLALYDPIARDDPTGGVPGDTPEERLERVGAAVHGRLGDRAILAHPDGGYLRVQVLWDDGTYQDAADAEFGEKVVIVESLMRPVG
ncbi:hypothetical protein [Microbacterium sp. NPDC096154]|uniref:hypothetical protein n=1 Tax=Microbacterium sp. NPDC096154 TaxID=3155549 RepID=UPI0033286570